MAAWFAGLPRDDPDLLRFAADVAMIVEHGLAPRVAVGALLHAIAEDEAAERRSR